MIFVAVAAVAAAVSTAPDPRSGWSISDPPWPPGGGGGVPPNGTTNNTTGPPPANFFNITFAATDGQEVQTLLTNVSPYILPGDSFDVLAGNDGNITSSVRNVDRGSSDLHAAFPDAKIFVHTSGILSYSELAPHMDANITGMSYDYEPGYEPEFTFNFSKTVDNFANVSRIAHEYGLESVGYPTGIPLLSAYLDTYDWDYGKLGRTVDQLFIQTQLFCQLSPTDYARVVSVVLDQYAAAGVFARPYFQISIGNATTDLPHGVTAPTAYACAQQLESLGVHTLYLWWDEGGLPDLLQFLSDIGRD